MDFLSFTNDFGKIPEKVIRVDTSVALTYFSKTFQECLS